MRKSSVKIVVKNAMQHYYKNGLTNTGLAVQQTILRDLDRLYAKKHRTHKKN